MKTIKNLLFVAFAAMAIAACQKELANPEGGIQNSGQVVNFTGTMSDIQTKTTVWYEEGLEKGTFPTRFLNADSVMVNGVSSGKETKASGTKLSFSVKGVEAPYFAVSATHVAKDAEGAYLANAYDSENHQYLINYNASQKYRLVNSNTNISFDSSADVFAAYREDENMQFKHLTTFLVITVDQTNSTETTNIKKIYVRQGDGSNIAGTWYVKFNADNEPYMEPAKLSECISYTCVVTGNNLSPDGVPQGSRMMIGVPAYDYQSGLIVTIEDMNGKFASFKINEANYASRGGAIIPFNPAFKPESKRTIKNADDWNEFAAHINATKGNAYQWVGGGAVVLEADIEAESLTQITADFKYVFDGNGKTITQTKATKPLFSKVSGEIKNLTLAGNLNLGSVSGAPLVNQLLVGAKLSACTNNMAVTCDRDGHTYVGGLVSFMESAVIENCINNGTLNVKVDVDNGFYNVAVAGIVADVRIPEGDEVRNVVLTNCKNTGALTLSPSLTFKSTASTANKGMQVCGFGGIAGWLRNTGTYTFTNCDNEGVITLSAAEIKNANGNSPRTICVGGVLGLSAPSTSGLMKPDFTKPYNVTLTDCDNSGLVYNQGVNYSSRGETNNKVFTGGIAGALAGVEGEHSKAVSCSNTGDIITHDLIDGQEDVIPSSRPNYSCVAGGLVGYGGFLDMDDVTVDCQIGNGKRQMAAWGGVVGFAIKKFSLKNSDIDVCGYFASYPGYDDNRAAVAVVPVKDGAKASNLVPSVIDSEISNNTIRCLLRTLTLPDKQDDTGSMKISDLSSEEYAQTIATTDEIVANLVCGEGFTANDGINIGNDNTYVAATAN